MQQDAAADEDYGMHRRGSLGGVGGASMMGSHQSLTEREEQSARNIKKAIDEIRKVWLRAQAVIVYLSLSLRGCENLKSLPFPSISNPICN